MIQPEQWQRFLDWMLDNARNSPRPIGFDEIFEETLEGVEDRHAIIDAINKRTDFAVNCLRSIDGPFDEREDLRSRFLLGCLPTDVLLSGEWTQERWVSSRFARSSMVEFFARLAAVVLHARSFRNSFIRQVQGAEARDIWPDFKSEESSRDQMDRWARETRWLNSELIRLIDRRQGFVSAMRIAQPGSHPPPKKATVIIHGTNAATEDWWRDVSGGTGGTPGKDNLWAFLSKNGVSDLIGFPNEFSWSGNNSDPARRHGASQFVNWWRTIGSPRLDVIAHSHGGNVAMLAATLEPNLHIRRFVLLGTPARFLYVPRPKQTEQLCNIYSEFDSWQVRGSWFGQRGEGRTQAEHAGATNYHLPYMSPRVRSVAADHSDLHHPDFWANHGLTRLLV